MIDLVQIYEVPSEPLSFRVRLDGAIPEYRFRTDKDARRFAAEMINPELDVAQVLAQWGRVGRPYLSPQQTPNYRHWRHGK